MPLEGCASVIQATKAYNKLPMLHYKTIKGIVDRDRRTEEEIGSLLKEKNICSISCRDRKLVLDSQSY